VGAEADAGPGYGLLGMRERVAALGGRLNTGPDGAGGFVVSAVLPAQGSHNRDRDGIDR
jgi:signal transduction histidine kinase